MRLRSLGGLRKEGLRTKHASLPRTTHLKVVLLDDHLEVETGELAQVAVGPGLLCPEHRPDLFFATRKKNKTKRDRGWWGGNEKTGKVGRVIVPSRA